VFIWRNFHPGKRDFASFKQDLLIFTIKTTQPLLTWFTLVQLKNSICYSINPNGILFIGNTGSPVIGLVWHKAKANSYNRLLLLFCLNSFIVLMDEQNLAGL
jgi:hypothetical protein